MIKGGAKECLLLSCAIVVYLFVFYFSVMMANRVEDQRLEEENRREAYYTEARP